MQLTFCMFCIYMSSSAIFCLQIFVRMSECCFLSIGNAGACGEWRGKSEVVRLLECKDDISIHLRAFHLSREDIEEWQLILARVGLFNIEKVRAQEMWICSRHRFSLGKNWKASKTACQYPLHKDEKSQRSKKKAAKGRTRVSTQMAREIQMLCSVLVPVGSRKYFWQVTSFRHSKSQRIIVCLRK